jgi:3-hydroxybutyryl-CoA dehydratase
MDPLQLIERRLQVDGTAIRRYADITQDFNPIHLDPEFAAKTPMGGIIAHGMLSLSLLWQSVQATLGNDHLPGAAMDIRFIKPVRENDWIVAGGQRSEDRGSYDVWVRAEREGGSEIVISGTFTIEANLNRQTHPKETSYEQTESHHVTRQ